ncbi:MAG: COX15/CtaA family protein [Planctomycetota bacterium]
MTARTSGPLPPLAAGFAASVAMWLVGYLAHLPGLSVPPWIVLPLMLACVVGAGFWIGRRAGAGAAGGAIAGGVTGIVNLLVLGSLVTGGGDETIPSAVIWVPGSIVVTMILGAVGAVIGRAKGGATMDAGAWRSAFVTVALVATLLVVIAGGVVTSTGTGLAVPDWPNTFGSNMFLYPLAKMTGGIYYEHAHRLYGALVGFTTIVLAVVLFATDARGWVRVLAIAAVLLVVGQGVLGGLRVDSALTMSVDPSETKPNLALAVVHGVLGQVFFATISVIWAITLPSWRAEQAPAPETASTDRTITATLLVLILFQLVFGAMYRHMQTPEEILPWPAHAHLTGAALVAVAGFLAGLRAWAKYPDHPVLKRMGMTMNVLLALQIILGFAALMAVIVGRESETPPPAEVILATAHQANGALLLAVATQLFFWVRRISRSDTAPSS